MTGVAVNVTVVPWQTLFWFTETEVLTGSMGLTTIVTVFEVAGLPEMHVRLDVITTYTWSPFVGI